jgi:hypothetical protein
MIAVWFVLGGMLGALNVWSQWWTIIHLHPAAPSAAMRLVIGGAVLRWSMVVGLLVAALRQSSVAGLLAFGGWWLARWIAVIWLNLRGMASIRAEDCGAQF